MGFTSWIVMVSKTYCLVWLVSPNESSTNHHLSVLYIFIHLISLHCCHMLKSRLIHSFITNQATRVLNSNLELQVERLAPSHLSAPWRERSKVMCPPTIGTQYIHIYIYISMHELETELPQCRAQLQLYSH